MMNNTDTKPIKTRDKNKLGAIPDGWTTPKISDVFQFINTTSFSRNQLNYDADNDLYYIHYGDIHATYKKPLLDFEIETNVPKLNSDVVLPNTIQYLKDGDVIIADASEDYEGVGEAIEIKNLNGKTAISGLHTFALRDIENQTIAGFRTYIFKNPNVKKALKTIATGSKVYGVSKGNIQKFKIVLPTLPEQQKIANILNTWDKAISAQEKLIKEKQELKKGLMQQLLTGKKRFSGFEEAWDTKRLGEIGKIVTGSTPKTKNLDNYGGNYLFVSPADIGKSKMIKTSLKTVTELGFNTGRKIPKNSIVFVCIGSTIGKIGISSCELITNQQINSIIPNGMMDSSFIYYQLLRNGAKIKLMAGEQAVPMINKSNFSTVKLSFPKLKEQIQISKVLSIVDIEIDYLKQENDMLAKQKQGLMRQLLTGVKRVKL